MQNPLAQQLFIRYFENGEDISDHAVLLDAAESDSDGPLSPEVILEAFLKPTIEMHPGFVVYSPETMMKLRDQTSKAVGANLDLGAEDFPRDAALRIEALEV